MSNVQTVKEATDIVKLIERDVKLKRSSGRFVGKCPMPHHEDKSPSFFIYPETQSFHCFGCGASGDALSYLQQKYGMDFASALQRLADDAGIVLERDNKRDEQMRRWRAILADASRWYQAQLHATNGQSALSYARERGLNDATITEWSLGYAPVPQDNDPASWRTCTDYLLAQGYVLDDLKTVGLTKISSRGSAYDTFRNRLMIPIHDHRGYVVGFSGRSLSADNAPKYLNTAQTPLFDKSDILFGYHRLTICDYVVVVEGHLDVIALWQAGERNVVGIQGSALSDTHFKQLSACADNIILAFDGDDAGHQAAIRSIKLSGDTKTPLYLMRLPDGQDPDDIINQNPQLWQALRDDAQESVAYLLETYCNPDMSVFDKQRTVQELLPILSDTQNDLYRQDNIQRLALALNIRTQDVLAMQQADERVTPQIADKTTNDMQLTILCALALEPMLDAIIERLLRKTGSKRGLSVHDFPKHGEAFNIVESALNQDDDEVFDYVHKRLSIADNVWQTTETITAEAIVQGALRLRLETLNRVLREAHSVNDSARFLQMKNGIHMMLCDDDLHQTVQNLLKK